MTSRVTVCAVLSTSVFVVGQLQSTSSVKVLRCLSSRFTSLIFFVLMHSGISVHDSIALMVSICVIFLHFCLFHCYASFANL